jgi:hypothetical protein
MNRSLRSALITVIAIAVASCLSYTPTATTTSATNFAWIEGRVLTVSGQGVAFAQVGVRIPTNRIPSAYALVGGETAATGDYDLVVQRVGDVGTAPTPDTLTVYVVAAQRVGSITRLDSTQFTLRFWPTGSVADPQKVDVHTEAP